MKRFVFAVYRLAGQHRSTLEAFLRPDFPLVGGDVIEPYFRDLDVRLGRLLDALEAALLGQGPADPESEPLRRAVEDGRVHQQGVVPNQRARACSASNRTAAWLARYVINPHLACQAEVRGQWSARVRRRHDRPAQSGARERARRGTLLR